MRVKPQSTAEVAGQGRAEPHEDAATKECKDSVTLELSWSD